MTTATATATATPASKLKPEVRNLADAIKQVAVFDDAGNGTGVETVYEQNQPEGLTKENYEARSAYNADFMAATALALGELGCKVLADNKELKKVHIDVPTFGKDHFSASFKRDSVIGNNTVYGATSLSYEVYGSKTAGQMAVVKDIIADKAREIFAKL